MNLTSIPAFNDNYIWRLSDDSGRCLVVDPGEARPVLDALKADNQHPVAILITHHHNDHTGGIAEIVAQYPDVEVYGPAEAVSKGVTHVLGDGSQFNILGQQFTVIATPGHTLGHICFYSTPWLFCGDTLFSGGCGRLFEGSAEQMFNSFQSLNQLPGDTLICCAHEYTLSNLAFANAIFPSDSAIKHYYREVKELREKKHITLPSTLDKERQINVFLRTQDNDLFEEISDETKLQQPEARFAWLRARKDKF
ncbi:hydroxyacylglutathione hydrolase [Salmonella enterica subsp. enterica serovar Choleraesuis]|nr:hydroxyacylglutathione hydrolase [Salmonella enterica subsp. enterica serovar Choleraesuis]